MDGCWKSYFCKGQLDSSNMEYISSVVHCPWCYLFGLTKASSLINRRQKSSTISRTSVRTIAVSKTHALKLRRNSWWNEFVNDKGNDSTGSREFRPILQDLLVLRTPWLMYSTFIFLFGFSLWHPESIQYPFSGLPLGLKGWPMLRVCQASECYIALYWASQSNMYVLISTPFFQKIENTLKSEIREFSR